MYIGETSPRSMAQSFNCVCLVPYFKAFPGKEAEVRKMFPRFVEKTSLENGVVYYDFFSNGDEFYCREAYRDAAAALAHLTNVGVLLDEMMKLADLTRVEIHGSASEVAKVKESLEPLHPICFIHEHGLVR
jgi:quinol monooxygenase YgiN